MHAEANSLSERVDRLEKSARRWKRATLATSLCLAGLGLSAAAPVMCDVVYGEKLVVRDESGRARVTIDAYHTELPSLAFQDVNGKVRARLAVDAEGAPFLASYDAKGVQTNTYRFVAQPATQSGGAVQRKPSDDPASIAGQ